MCLCGGGERLPTRALGSGAHSRPPAVGPGDPLARRPTVTSLFFATPVSASQSRLRPVNSCPFLVREPHTPNMEQVWNRPTTLGDGGGHSARSTSAPRRQHTQRRHTAPPQAHEAQEAAPRAAILRHTPRVGNGVSNVFCGHARGQEAPDGRLGGLKVAGDSGSRLELVLDQPLNVVCDIADGDAGERDAALDQQARLRQPGAKGCACERGGGGGGGERERV